MSEPSRPRGRPPKCGPDELERAKQRYLAGDSAAEIGALVGVTGRTIEVWAVRHGWRAELRARRETISGLEAQIADLSRRKATPRVVDMLAKATKALGRLRQSMPKPKERPQIANAVHKELLAQALAPEYGLYTYQREFLLSEDRFRLILKARQIGFSFALGLAVVLGAMAGRDQLVVSASEMQSQIVIRYARLHAERLGITPDDDGKSLKEMKIGGVVIRAMPANFRTIQGWPGDVWLDEFGWAHKPQRIWNAIVPSITQMGGRVTVCSTPFVPGTLFWELAVNHNNRWPQFARTRITIQDAVNQGMPLPGGIDELRALFDSESWAMLYECEWAEDGEALLAWTLLHELATGDETRFWDGLIDSGVDVGQVNDRFVELNCGDEGDAHRVLHYTSKKGWEFAQMKAQLAETERRYTVRRRQIDQTGIGRNLAKDCAALWPHNTIGRDFTSQWKERAALNILKLAEDRKLILINDPYLLSRLHAVKKRVTASGIKYDAARDDEGHADEFWALALALDGRARAGLAGSAPVVEVWH